MAWSLADVYENVLDAVDAAVTAPDRASAVQTAINTGRQKAAFLAGLFDLIELGLVRRRAL